VKKVVLDHATDYLAAAALLPARPILADADPVAKAAQLDTAIVLSCRQYLDLHPDLPLFAPWRELTQMRDADGVRQHYGPIFTAALAAKKGPEYDALNDAKGFLTLPAKDADVLDSETLAKIAAMNAEVADMEAKGPELPAIMSVADSEKVVPALAIHLRGSYLTLGKVVERNFPEVMRTSYSEPIFPAKHSGRLELARWMASSEHPLTARVIVNRIWTWHFGQGIVATTDNFGLLGARPSHPELLDWLARNFIENGWSIKDLHRLIMKSATYQQASTVSFSESDKVDPRIVDPEDHLLWRAHIERLEAEEIRDAMLMVSDWLDLQMGGKTIPLHDKEFVFNHTSKDATTYESARRALYLPVIRNHLYNMLEQFDYPDPTMPTGARNSTVIAPQALIMMNSPVVMEASQRLAAKLAKLSDDDRRLEQVYALLYSRPPLDHEKADALALLHDFATTEPPDRAWAMLCHTLMAANEFIYLR